MKELETLAANLAHAARTQKPALIGGGEFSPAECAELARLIREFLSPENKLVPVNPTPEMLEASNDSIRWFERDATSRACYAAMLNAAPLKG